MSVLIIGAGGAVGKRLVAALAARGERIVAVDRAAELPEGLRRQVTHAETNADVRDFFTMQRIFKRHRFVHTVWNLAAPLSVETALNPEIAHQVTVNGMRNVLWAMYEAKVKKIMFTDSIGSFGATAPREECTARWLTEHPSQDPGSDYGRQKRGVRRLLLEFWMAGGDPRWAVLPGVLHSEEVWGKGTTEYALEALLAAVSGKDFVCPIDPDEPLPMIFVDDLMRGLLALQDADESKLRQPERGYAIPGLSFTARELFSEIQIHYPNFRYTVELDPNMSKFAKLWPNTLSRKEALEDLGYDARVGLREMVFKVIIAHKDRFKAKTI